MSNQENIYDKNEFASQVGLRIMFISQGVEDVIKVVDYEFVEESNNRKLYNLGFGDYNLARDIIEDNVNTNNGDGRMVLNTVLSTIPTFFAHYPDCTLIIQGSDSRPEYSENCRQTCLRCHEGDCRKAHRRINLYQNYVNTNFELLNTDYQFFGGYYDETGQKIEEDYMPNKKYFSVLLTKRNK